MTDRIEFLPVGGRLCPFRQEFFIEISAKMPFLTTFLMAQKWKGNLSGMVANWTEKAIKRLLAKKQE